MISIPNGRWAIQSVLVNDVTVMNDARIQVLEILEQEWSLQPSGQVFCVIEQAGQTAVLRSNGVTFLAAFEVSGRMLHLELSRDDLSEKVNLRAELVSEEAFVDAG